MIKRLLCLIVLFCFFLTSGCSRVETPLVFERYSIVEEEGKWYFRMDPVEPSTSGALVGPFPQFSSVKEMRDKLIAGEIEDDVLDFIQKEYCRNGSIEICDLNNLYEFEMPNDVTLETVCLGYDGVYYHCKMKSDIGSISMNYCSKEIYEKVLSYEEGPLARGNILTAVETIEDRNATQYLYHNDVASLKELRYDIHIRGKNIHVIENYCLEYYGTPKLATKNMVISETIPNSMCIFIEENGVYSYVDLYIIKQRPTVKWIKAFGLDPF